MPFLDSKYTKPEGVVHEKEPEGRVRRGLRGRTDGKYMGNFTFLYPPRHTYYLGPNQFRLCAS